MHFDGLSVLLLIGGVFAGYQWGVRKTARGFRSPLANDAAVIAKAREGRGTLVY